MFKYKIGTMTSRKLHASKVVAVNLLSGRNIGSLILGGGTILLGTLYLAMSSYTSGAKDAADAIYEAAVEAHMEDDSDSSENDVTE